MVLKTKLLHSKQIPWTEDIFFIRSLYATNISTLSLNLLKKQNKNLTHTHTPNNPILKMSMAQVKHYSHSLETPFICLEEVFVKKVQTRV